MIASIFFYTSQLIAQHDFRPGFVVVNSGDTLLGEIDYRSDFFMSKECVFRPNSKAKKSTFFPDSLNSYKFTDGRYFVSRKVKQKELHKQVFLEYLIKGKVDVFYYRDQGDHYYIQKDGFELMELPYTEELVFNKYANGYYYQKSTKHQDRLKYLMKDAPSIKKKIEKLERPDHDDLVQLAEEYHQIVCKDTACVIYYKQPYPIKINPEILAGFANFSNTKDIQSSNYFMGGILVHAWAPRASEKVFIKSGILFSNIQFTYRKESNTVAKIPLHLEYFYPSGVVRPNLSAGPNFYFPGAVSLSAYAGIRCKIHQILHLTAGVDLFDKVSGFSFLGGLYFQLP